MVSVLQTMSSVIYSIFLLRKSFTCPTPCQVVWRKDELLGLTRDASATGVKTQQLVRSRLVSQWHGPSQPFHTKIGITTLFKLNNSHTPGNRIFQHSLRCSRPQDTLFIHPFIGGYGLGMVPNGATQSKPFSGSQIHCAMNQKGEGSTRKCQQKQLQRPDKDTSLENIWGWRVKVAPSPQIHTLISQHNCRRNRKVF